MMRVPEAGLGCLPAAGDGEGAGGDVRGDDRARGDERAVADGDRGDERGVRADEGAGADLGPVLEDAVVVAGDGAGADVGAARRRGRRRCR